VWVLFSGRGRCLGDLAPNREGAPTCSAADGGGRGFWIRNVEEVCDLIVNGQEPLPPPGGLEALHAPLPSPRQLMRILRPIVQSLMLAMFDVKAHLRPRRARIAACL